MRYIALLFLCVALLPCTSHATITEVNASANGQGGIGCTTPTVCSTSISGTSGNAYYVIVHFNASPCSTITGITVTDATTLQNFTPNGSINTTLSPYSCSQQFTLIGISATSTQTITATFTGTPAVNSISVIQFHTTNTWSGVDSTLGGPQGTAASGSVLTSPSFSTASLSANEVIIAGATNYYLGSWTAGSIGGTTATIDPNSTIGSGASDNGNLTVEYLIVTTTQSSITAAINNSGANGVYGTILVTGLQETGSAPASGAHTAQIF